MNLSNLPKSVKRSSKRVGRGYGSGKGGHTSGRGTKGQKARGSIPEIFEGTKVKKSFIKRLPLLRGKGRMKPWGKKPVIFNLTKLSDWPASTAVTLEALIKKGVVDSKVGFVKILGEGEIKQALEVKVAVSEAAKQKILKAGGKIA